MPIKSNIKGAIKYFEASEKRLDTVAKNATKVVGQMAVREIKSQVQGKRTYRNVRRQRDTKRGAAGTRYRIYDKATANEPPKNRTGILKNSVRANQPEGFNGRYTVIVGPYAEYARVLELGGNPHWPSGLKFPFVEPASKIVQRRARQVFIEAVHRALS